MRLPIRAAITLTEAIDSAMISISILSEAKAFLSWEVFDNLSIQLVPLQSAVAYHYPPGNRNHSIVVFYDPEDRDLSKPVFYLFHEAGHAMQYEHHSSEREFFHSRMALDRGPERREFEQQAWDLGRHLFIRFLAKQNLEADVLLDRYDEFSQLCLDTYRY
jgi:hypothetical protein